MIDFKNAYEDFHGNIYDYIDDTEIYMRLLGYYPNPRQKYRSPFSRDSDPSFVFVQKDRLLWQCFSTGSGGDAISLVAKIEGLSYKEAIIHVKNKYPLSRKPQVTYKEYKPIEIKVVLFDKIPKSFYDYWDSFNVSRKTLEEFNIKPAKEVWLNKDGEEFLAIIYKEHNPVIRYLINGKYKIYQPLNRKDRKWLSNTRIIDVQGWKELPKKGDLLIISKAMKDILVWKELGYNAIALSSETANMPTQLVDNVKKRFNKIISFLDNDEAGMATMERYYNEFGIPYTHIPKNLECKDIAEFSYLYGLDECKKLLETLNI